MHDRLTLHTAPTTAAGPIAIMPQRFEPFLVEALDAVPADRLPDLRASGSPWAIIAEVAEALAASRMEPAWLAEWLGTNISFQLRLFGQLTGSQTLRLRLEAVADDGCSRFHADAVRYRLICTYRGPGTEWIDPKALARAPSRGSDGRFPATSDIRRLERGAVAFMRGARDATAARPALLHRSPPIEGSGVVRLVLVIDAAEP